MSNITPSRAVDATFKQSRNDKAFPKLKAFWKSINIVYKLFEVFVRYLFVSIV